MSLGEERTVSGLDLHLFGAPFLCCHGLDLPGEDLILGTDKERLWDIMICRRAHERGLERSLALIAHNLYGLVLDSRIYATVEGLLGDSLTLDGYTRLLNFPVKVSDAPRFLVCDFRRTSTW